MEEQHVGEQFRREIHLLRRKHQNLQGADRAQAGGNLGTHITAALLATARHTVTALTRTNSTSVFPAAITAVPIDYDDHAALVRAPRGQDALIVTLSGRAEIAKTEAKFVRAAADADVPWILPNEWSPDTADEGLVQDLDFLFHAKVETRKLIAGVSRYVALVTGFWYEYSLAMPENYGFDFAKREVRFYDDGEAAVSTSTWPHIGRAVAALLSLPARAEGERSPCLEDYADRMVYSSSFTVSQREMLASACRVTKTSEAEWKVSRLGAPERFEQGRREVSEGKMAGFGKLLYTRLFFPGAGEFERKKETIDGALGLQKEKPDGATAVAIERQATMPGKH